MKNFTTYLLLFIAIQFSSAQFYGPNDFRISDAGGFGSTITEVDFPDLAYNFTIQNYLVVWDSDDTDQNGVVNNNNQIIGRFTDLNGNIQGNDILISSLNLGNNQRRNLHPRITFNTTDNNYLVVYQGDFNSNKTEAYGVIVNQDGTLNTTDFRISFTAANEDGRSPAIAYNPNLNEYLAIFISRILSTSTTPARVEITGQRISNTGVLLGNAFDITNSITAGAQTNGSIPDIIFNPLSNEYLVTYVTSPITNEEEAYATIVSQTGVVGNTVRLSNRGAIDNSGFVNKSVRAAHSIIDNSYLFVYEADNSTAGEYDVFGVIYDAAMNLLVPEFEISQVGGSDTRLDAVIPHVEWLPADNMFYVVFQANPFFSDRNEREIFMRSVSSTGTVGANLLRVSEAPVAAAGSATQPRIVSNGDGALLTVYKAEDTSTQSMMVNGEFEIYGQFYGTATFNEAEQELTAINLYPNPALNEIYITGLDHIFSFSVYDAIGKQVFKKQNHSSDQPISITDFSKGLYFIEIELAERKEVIKFIKE
ncbi:hypothetical protein BST92_03045 [Nonlabens arenilitoris]|uniref:Secretion system C-terminal sorting domain-containing protein n=1 Tax=Nonlabens arenilitoris TaxID=1217969 RepID=A0A2S7U7K5_9FLAO|nr:T9SS type A sorting domain-containing protein [Nonlabens arenilitoris]PQJ30968.1 hypothetical protein BST92_03045 [Nonlabens arenilitoris]